MANSLIDFGVVQPEAGNAFLRNFQQAQNLGQQQQVQQRQNALADLQLRAAQRGEEESLAEREAAKGATSLQELQARYQQAGLAKQAIALQKQIQEQQATKLKQLKDTHDVVQAELRPILAVGTRESVDKALARAEAMGLDVSSAREAFAQVPDSEIRKTALALSNDAKAAFQQQFIDTGIGTVAAPSYALGAPAAAAPAAVGVPAMPTGVPGATPFSRAANVNALALPAPNVGPVAQAGVPYTAPGGLTVYPKGISPAQQATETREQQRIGLEERRVKLAEEEAARKQAGLAEPLSKQEVQKRESKYPQAKSAMQGFESQSNDMIQKLEQLKEHKGLEGIIGTVYGRTPSLTKESQAAQALYDQVLAKGKFQELQNMRLASPTGGALGNVSNMEIQSLGQAFGALSRIQGKESFQSAIDDVIKQIQSSKDRTKEAFDETYQYKQNNSVSPAAPAAGKAKFLGFEK